MREEKLKEWVNKIIACYKRHSEGDQIGGQFPEDILAKFEEEVRKDELVPFLDFLLKEGYCDADVYAEPPKKDLTIIDAYLIHKSKTKKQ